MAPGEVIVTMDADCTYPGRWCRSGSQASRGRLAVHHLRPPQKAEDGAMSGLHGFGNWALSFTARMLFFYGIHDSQSGMWVLGRRLWII